MNLYVNTYGAYIHVKDEIFEIRYKVDDQEEKHHYSAKKVANIVVTTGAAISTDAIKLAMEHNIEILFLERSGRPYSRIWHCRMGSTSRIRRAQLNYSTTSKGLEIAKEWVLQKMQNQLEFLKELKKHRKNQREIIDGKLGRINELYNSVVSLDVEKDFDAASTLRGLEGTAGRIYFEALSSSLAKQYQFAGRSSRPAKNPFNAFLNYAYGILYGRIEKALVIAGLDPYIGFMHRDDYNQTSFVFDFIEPYRIIGEKVVFRLFSAKKVKKEHTDELNNEAYTLNKEGKKLLIESFNNYFEEQKIRYRNRNQSRANALQLEAHHFANTLLKSLS